MQIRMIDEDEDADALAFALAARPERIEDGLLSLAPPGFRAKITVLRERLVALALGLPEASPSAALRARILETTDRQAPRRALLVIDMIHDHLDPGSLVEVPRARNVIPALEERLDAARAAGIPIVYILDQHEPDDPDLDAWGTHAVKGTKGALVWDAIAPREGDRVVTKPTYSAFFASDLASVLEELGVDTLVLTGCLTEIGVLATATDAMQRGYAVEVPPDSQAGSSPEAEAAALGTLSVMAPFGPARKTLLERVAA